MKVHICLKIQLYSKNMIQVATDCLSKWKESLILELPSWMPSQYGY